MVVLVDRQEVARRQVARALMAAGHKVTQVGAAADVLPVVERQLPSMLVVDLETLGDFGDVLIAECRARFPQMLVVATGAQAPSAEKCARVHAFVHRSDLATMLPDMLEHALRVHKAFATPAAPRVRLVAV